MKMLFSLFRDEEAATAIEYALIVALVSIIGVIASNMAGQEVSNSFSNISSTITSSTGP